MMLAFQKNIPTFVRDLTFFRTIPYGEQNPMSQDPTSMWAASQWCLTVGDVAGSNGEDI